MTIMGVTYSYRFPPKNDQKENKPNLHSNIYQPPLAPPKKKHFFSFNKKTSQESILKDLQTKLLENNTPAELYEIIKTYSNKPSLLEKIFDMVTKEEFFTPSLLYMQLLERF